MEAVDPAAVSRRIAGDGTPASAWRADAALAAVPTVALAELEGPGARMVLVAPHPDDEILAWGGLLAMLAARGDPALLVAVTDGEGSHPGSPEWPPARLREARPRETLAALETLGAAASQVVRLGIADGGVRAAEAALAQRLEALIEPGDVVVTTWRYDGHPDHEACARACAAAAAARGATVLETPVWGWHWSAPGDGMMPLARARKLALAPAELARKRSALACFRSQLEADRATGAAPVVPASALERLLQAFELFFHA